MNFENQLHEDLFDLFIMNCICWNMKHINKDYDLFRIFQKGKVDSYKSIRSLFPQQNHPEEFVGHVSDLATHYHKKGGGFMVEAKKCEHFKHKIKIVILGDEE